MPGHGHGVVVHRQHALDGTHLLKLPDLRSVQVDRLYLARSGLYGHAHDPVGRGVREGIHQRGIDHAEYRRGGSNAEG